jgi:hypothetical protein
MAGGAIAGQFRLQVAMESILGVELQVDIFVAAQACRSHRLPRTSVTSLAVLGTGKSGVLGMNGRDLAG